MTAKSEVLGVPEVISLNGVDYTIPAEALNDIQVLDLVEAEKYINAVRKVLGEAQWSSFKEANRDDEGKVTVEVFQALTAKVLAPLSTLGIFLRDCPDELEADLHSEYGIDIADLWSGEISVTKVSRLTAQLPDGARVWRAMGSDRAWMSNDHLLAQVFDVLNWANYQRAEGKGEKPKPLPRPQELHEKVTKASRKEMLAIEAARRLKTKKQS